MHTWEVGAEDVAWRVRAEEGGIRMRAGDGGVEWGCNMFVSILLKLLSNGKIVFETRDAWLTERNKVWGDGFVIDPRALPAREDLCYLCRRLLLRPRDATYEDVVAHASKHTRVAQRRQHNLSKCCCPHELKKSQMTN